MRLPIWLKLTFTISLVFCLALWAVLQSTNDVFYQDKRNFLVEMSSKINSSVANVFNERIYNTRKKLAIFTSNYESLSPAKRKHPDLDKIIFSQYPEFLAIGLIVEQENTPISWLRIHPASDLKNWPDSFLASLLSPEKNKTIGASEVSIRPFKGFDTEQYLLFTFPVQLDREENPEGKIVAIVEKTMFSDLLDDYKTSLNTVFVTNSNGKIVAHPFSENLGKDFTDHPLVQQVVVAQKKQGVGDSFEDQEGEDIVASFQSVTNSNLVVYTTTPKKEAFSAANELWRNLVVIAFGVLLIGIVVSLLFTKVITKPLDRLKKIAKKIGSGKFDVEVDVHSNDEVGDLAGSIRQMTKDLIERDEALEHSKKALVQSEKMSAFGQLSAGIAHEVKNPLAGILGHAQLAKSKSKDKEILKHVGFIEKETRRTKEIIENLMKFARAEKLELVPTNLYDAVHGAVDLVDHQLSLQEIKIFRHIERVPAVLGQTNQIQQVLMNLMMNAGHAMEGRDKKELHVFLEEKDDVAQIRIQDSGCGMPKDVQERIFEPFFTTKPAGKGTGLGLSVSVGIIKDHNGKIYIESEENVGTTFFIDIPINEEVELPASTRASDTVEQDQIADQIVIAETEVEKESKQEEEDIFSPEKITSEMPKLDTELDSKIADDKNADQNQDKPMDKKLDDKEVKEEDYSLPKAPEDSFVEDLEDLDTIAREAEKQVEEESATIMHSSRDYLMTEEEKENQSKKRFNKKHRSKLKNKLGDFKVKIRKPKAGNK